MRNKWRWLSIVSLSASTLALIVWASIITVSKSDNRAAAPCENFRKVTIACVNFNTIWGEKKSLNKIKRFIKEASNLGADIIVFPELTLTGYEVEEAVEMHSANAEIIPGPSTNEIALLTSLYKVYVVLGMPEKDKECPYTFYNSAAIIGHDGVIGSYAKLMPYKTELKWCRKGEYPFCFVTPWGLVGVGICYETYMFPELARYYSALGVRLYVNLTALSEIKGWKEYYLNQLQARAIENMIFVASSNLVGKNLSGYFPG